MIRVTRAIHNKLALNNDKFKIIIEKCGIRQQEDENIKFSLIMLLTSGLEQHQL